MNTSVGTGNLSKYQKPAANDDHRGGDGGG